MPQIQSNTDRTFLINNQPYQRGSFNILPPKGDALNPTIEIIFQSDKRTLSKAPLSEWTDDVGGSFADYDAFIAYVEPFFFRSLTGGGGGGSVDSVTGDGVDNTDPSNPVILYPTPADINAVNKSGDTMSGNLDMGTNNIINGGSVAITGSYTGTDYNGVPLTSLGDGSQSLNDDGTYSPKIEEATGTELNVRLNQSWQSLKGGAESFPIGSLEGNSNMNIGDFWGVAVQLEAGSYDQMFFILNQYNPTPSQSWVARCGIYDITTQSLLVQGSLTLDDQLGTDFPQIDLDSTFVLERARYVYLVLGANDNIGGGNLQAKRITANNLNEALISFSFQQTTGALPATLPTINQNNNQWFSGWYFNS